ncbi:MAG: hypothetical protein K1W17_04175 [Oscillospiraceae bacterium]
MTVKNFFELMESQLYFVDVDLYFDDDCENAVEMTADEVVSKYADREIISFDTGYDGMSVTIKGGC